MFRLFVFGLTVALSVVCSGIAVADEGKDESGKGRRAKHHHRGSGEESSYFDLQGYSHLDIPKGHYPPPGQCRIWYPGRPAGHQRPAGDCDLLAKRVPPDAWLIRHPEDEPDHVHVVVYDEHRPGRIKLVGEFEIGSGMFIRVVLD